MSGTGQEKGRRWVRSFLGARDGTEGGGGADGTGKRIVPSEVYSGRNKRRQGVVLVPIQVPRVMDDTLAGTGQEKDQMVPSLFSDRTEPDASTPLGRRQGVREMVETDTQHGRPAEREIILVLDIPLLHTYH